MKPEAQTNRDTWGGDSMKLVTGDRITSVLAAIKDAASYLEVDAILAPLRRKDTDAAVVGEYRLELGSLDHLQREYDGLLKVKDLNLSSAPRAVELYCMDEGFGVLVTKIEAVHDAELKSASFGAGKPLTTEEVRDALRLDVDKLLDAGLWNHALQKGGCWYLNPETKRVIISPWFPVEDAKRQDVAKEVEQVRRMIDHA